MFESEVVVEMASLRLTVAVRLLTGEMLPLPLSGLSKPLSMLDSLPLELRERVSGSSIVEPYVQGDCVMATVSRGSGERRKGKGKGRKKLLQRSLPSIEHTMRLAALAQAARSIALQSQSNTFSPAVPH